MAGKIPLMAQYPAIEASVVSGKAPDRSEGIPTELSAAVNAVERAKDATIYTAMKAAMKYMQALESEEEFIEYLANLLIDIYASDSALARAVQAVRRGDENADIHVKLAQLATWLAFNRIRSNLDQVIATNFSEGEIQEELPRVRAYLGDYLVNGVALQREIADLVVQKQGYPLEG